MIMKNNFAEDYAWSKRIHDAYDMAEEAGDQEGMAKARAEYKEQFTPYMTEKGEGYWKLYELYARAKNVGNEYIDFSDVIWDKDVPAKIDGLREYGIERFTFSSTWSSSVETAWLFLQNGCTLEGMTEINSQHRKIFTEEYERIPAYIFKVN